MTVRWAIVAALALAGCHVFFPFDRLPAPGSDAADGRAGDDARLDGGGDVGGDATDAPCALTQFSPPVLLPGPVNAPEEDDWSPSLSPDQLTIYFKSWRPGGLGLGDIWVATRADLSSAFEQPVNLSEVNSPCDDSAPAIAADGRTLFFASGRDPSGGTSCSTNDDIWVATRKDLDAAFSAPTHVTELSSPTDDTTPHLTADGLTLYFASWRAPEGTGFDLWVARRASPTAPFDKIQQVPGVNSPSKDICPSLSPDGLRLYFVSDRSGTSGKLDLWIAERTDAQSGFGTPKPVPQLSTPDDEFGPFIAADGRTLYFNRGADVQGDPNKYADIWVSTLSCAPGG